MEDEKDEPVIKPVKVEKQKQIKLETASKPPITPTKAKKQPSESPQTKTPLSKKNKKN